ncbi:Transcription factor tga like domain [Thalictrum thalictroides]|uniref:Transcription factor tga like domain n=1 Tax=Thalictrum thalictroides TaxID=46969 RepID=A0A7J6W419_THATH|nr:Transcription factor tga like domain [Thalictrum thalictroides]
MSSKTCPFHRCFDTWVTQQRKDLEELVIAKNEEPRNEETLRLIAEKNVENYQDYFEKRSLLSKEDALISFSSIWCTGFENSFLWIGGCRPTLSIQLVYTLCGMELENHLTEFFQGVRRGDLAELGNRQLCLINDLHCRIVQEEEDVSSRLSILQEDIGNESLFLEINESSLNGDINGQIHDYKSLDDHSHAITQILVDADMLRLQTVKELVNILIPLQAVDFLVAAKKLYLSMHQWGQRKYIEHGRFCQDN